MLPVGPATLLVATLALPLAANPFTGAWQTELIFTPTPLVFQFVGDERYLLRTGETEVEQAYTWDEETRLLNLGEVQGTVMDARYRFLDDDTFVLFFGDQMKEALAAQMVFDVPAGSNEVTVRFAENLMAAVLDALDQTPILRAERLR